MGLIPWMKRSKVLWSPRDSSHLSVAGWEKPIFGVAVAKAGRTTGTTIGSVEFRYAHVRFPGDGGITTSELCILGQGANRFAETGDSGSAVFNSTGKLVGLVLGGTYGVPVKAIGHEALGEIHLTYMMPIDLIMERLQLLRGSAANLL